MASDDDAIHHRSGRVWEELSGRNIDLRRRRKVIRKGIEICQVSMAFGGLTKERPSKPVIKGQIRTYTVLILGEEFEFILVNVYDGICVGLTKDDNVAKQKVSPLLLKAIARGTDVQKVVNAIVDAKSDPSLFS